MKDSSSHLWKLALGLGLVILAILIWGRTSAFTPTEPGPAAEVLAIEPQPSAAPTTGQPVSRPDLRPTPSGPGKVEGGKAAGSEVEASTLLPTPIPVYHTVRQGEFPLLIAEQYGISVDALLAVNSITDPTRLQIGQQLLVPVMVTPPPATPSPPPTPTLTPVYHTVQQGDTLSDIAQTYNVNAAIIRLSNEAVDSLQPGQKLLIPASPIGPDIPVQTHTIESGDTFDRLAYLYGSTIDDIIAANPALNPVALRVGQQVIVPVTAPPVNPAANPRAPQIINPEPTPPKLAVLQQQVLDQTNVRRQANGLPPLQADPELAVIALAHAQDMIKRGYFAHITPEGIDLRARFAQHGVEANWIGENIQFNTRPENEAVDSAITWLMNSAPHRANMLHTRFTHLGVGVFEEPAGWYTFVLVFAGRGWPGENSLPDTNGF